MIKPWEEYIRPYQVYGNVYFVGSRCGSTHMIVGRSGSLILIDSGYPQTLYLLLENIRRLGFDPSRIKHVIHSHGHYDHLGATRALIELYHPVTYLGAGDLDYATGARNLTWADELGYEYTEYFTPDVLLHDGDVITADGIEFTFIESPGHSEGAMSCFFLADGCLGPKRCGMFGGAGFNSLSPDFLDKYHLPRSLRDDFIHSLDRAMKEHVDIHLGNHVSNNKMFEKLHKRDIEGGNPFIDENDWKSFLETTKKSFLGSL